MILTTTSLALRLQARGVPVRMRPDFAHKVIHDLDQEQMDKLAEALGDCSDWPAHTDDPRVNYAVDCLVSFEGKPPLFDEATYIEEVEAFKRFERTL